MIDVMGGQAHMTVGSIVQSIPHIRSGKLKPIATGGSARAATLPDLPTIAEAGVPGYEVVGWNGILAPANTPRPIIDKLNTAILAALKTPEMEKLLSEQGIEPAGNSPEEFAQLLHADIEKWIRVTREAGIKPQ